MGELKDLIEQSKKFVEQMRAEEQAGRREEQLQDSLEFGEEKNRNNIWAEQKQIQMESFYVS